MSQSIHATGTPRATPPQRQTRPPYRVPFEVTRAATSGSITLRNSSSDPVTGVTAAVLGTGLLLSKRPARLAPGDELTLRIKGSQLSVRTVVVVRWFRHDGQEYLWRISF